MQIRGDRDHADFHSDNDVCVSGEDKMWGSERICQFVNMDLCKCVCNMCVCAPREGGSE